MSGELRLLKYDREKERKKLEKKIKNNWLVLLKDESDFVKLDNEGKFELAKSLLDRFKDYGEIRKIYSYIPGFSIRVDDRIEEEFVKYTRSPEIREVLRRAEHDQVVSIPDPISEEGEDKQWNLKLVQADKAQRFSKGSGISVAVIDTGVDYNHPEIEENFFKYDKGYNVINDNRDPFDDNGHGTHCSGIIAGENVGVAPAVTLKAVKFLDMWGFGTLEDAITAVEWCIENRVDITSNSWGGPYSEAEKMVFDAAWERGIMNVAAAGNTGDRSMHYPSCFDSVISVPAVDENEQRAWFSTMNDQNEVAAPGVRVNSCIPGRKYAKYSGTSMACPHVAGGAASVKSFWRARAKDVRKNLAKHAKPLGGEVPNEKYGHGLLQVYKSLMWFFRDNS